MTETTSSAGNWNLSGLKDAILGGNKGKSEEEQATINAALREETKLKEERGEETSGWRQKVCFGFGERLSRVCEVLNVWLINLA